MTLKRLAERLAAGTWLNAAHLVPDFRIAVVIAGLCALAFTLRADQFVVDQDNEFDASGVVLFYTIGFNLVVGQEFTPSSNSLGFVDLATDGDGASGPSVQVLIRQGTITNPVLATSDTVPLTNGTSVATNRFRFEPALELSPGTTYVMQPVPGADQLSAVASGPDTYPGGRMIHNGQPDASADLWFREGSVVPAPDSTVLSIQVSQSQIEVSWSSSASKTYQVQYTADLTTSLWTNLGPPVSGNGLTNSFTDAVGGSAQFYRVLTLQ
jgi:hypothetical protein